MSNYNTFLTLYKFIISQIIVRNQAKRKSNWLALDNPVGPD